jgi:hypothetical protein
MVFATAARHDQTLARRQGTIEGGGLQGLRGLGRSRRSKRRSPGDRIGNQHPLRPRAYRKPLIPTDNAVTRAGRGSNYRNQSDTSRHDPGSETAGVVARMMLIGVAPAAIEAELTIARNRRPL